jgi:hypothetical protein
MTGPDHMGQVGLSYMTTFTCFTYIRIYPRESDSTIMDSMENLELNQAKAST